MAPLEHCFQLVGFQGGGVLCFDCFAQARVLLFAFCFCFSWTLSSEGLGRFLLFDACLFFVCLAAFCRTEAAMYHQPKSGQAPRPPASTLRKAILGRRAPRPVWKSWGGRDGEDDEKEEMGGQADGAFLAFLFLFCLCYKPSRIDLLVSHIIGHGGIDKGITGTRAVSCKEG